uniref:Calcineurin-like phosphoesterase domain-containing protein n=1 Tax=Arcella intermedia TaxID=1963864 RepID=A0A6B2L5M9_9EUKA
MGRVKQLVESGELKVGAIVDGEYGETALHYGAYWGHERIVLYLLSARADVNAVGTVSTATPLHSAAAGGHAGVCSILLNFRANVNQFTSTGWTPLHSAALRSFDHVCYLLEQAGANKDLITKERHAYKDLLRIPQHKPPTTNTNQLLVQGKLHIQVASDIHIEFYPDFESTKSIIKPSAPVLALCGDIGSPLLPNYEQFLLYQADKFKLVLVLTGNHEYYNMPNQRATMSEIDKSIEAICKKRGNIHFMNKKKIEIEGYDILGCTLWGVIPKSERQKMVNVLNDFNLIYVDKTTRFSPDHFNDVFEDSLSWLTKEIKKSTAAKRKIVVLTHHTPTFDAPGTGYGWASDLNFLFALNGNTNLLLWCFGHTHANMDKVIRGTRVLSNQKGYTNEQTYKSFKSDHYVEI